MPEEAKSERVQLMMTPAEVKAVDDWSFESRIRGRSEAIRRLIDIGLQAVRRNVTRNTLATRRDHHQSHERK